MRARRFFFLICLALGAFLAASVHGAATDASTAFFQTKAKPFLEEHCLDCHDESSHKGGVRLDTLKPQFASAEDAARWTSVFDQIQTGAMPPKKKARPPQADNTAMLQWVGTGLLSAEATSRKAEGAGVVRRLNRAEYENTVRDLLGIGIELQELLPEDASFGGFDNVGEAMNTSAILLERYMDAAEKALDAATASKPRPETKSGEYKYTAKMIPAYLTKTAKETPEAMVFYGSSYSLSSFKPHADGIYRIKVHAAAYDCKTPVHYSLVGSQVLTGNRTLGYFEAPPGAPNTVEVLAGLRAGAQLKVTVYPYSLVQADIAAGRDPVNMFRTPELGRAGLAIYSFDIEGPLIDQWPPESHRKLFGDGPIEQMGKVQPSSIDVLGKYGASQVLTPTAAKPEEEITRIITAFLPRAFRRPATAEETQAHVQIALNKLKNGGTFEDAIRLGVKTALCSPSFLFLKEAPGKLDAYALASRLSYFLWSTMPDDALLAASAKGELAQLAGLRVQVERMLKSPKAREFTENFTGQWLGLRDIDATSPDALLYPEYDEWLQMSAVNETHRFFDELLAQDLSVANFIDSKFALLNNRLAKLYGVPGVDGLDIRKVALPAGSHRGGVLTQAAILKVTANGTTTSPVVRGSWVMRNIVGKPVPPPPENVPAIEPDIRGAKTIRDQLSKHRSTEGCAGCHSKMDPLGFALENFDVIGGWRDKYRILAPNVKVNANARANPLRPIWLTGAPIEAADTLTSGATFKDIDELKTLLLADRSQIARCVAEKLLIYATGRPLGFTDRNSVNSILASTKGKDYGLRTIVHAVVESDAFLSK